MWISVWGGVNTLAQALYKIENTKTKKEAKKLISKLRVYTISDQDDSGIWIRDNFPDVFFIVSPGDDYGSATWTGINGFFKGINNDVISNKWIADNIQQNHGPLGTEYPDVAWGVEGDTPAASFNDYKVTLWRWREDFQNDFAARIDWCLCSYEKANHPPVPVLSHSENITVKSGQGFSLDAFNSTDPDGDNLSFLWFNYPEAGTLKEEIKINGAENAHVANFTAPKVDKKETAHFILRLTDKGTPALTRYKRVIVTIVPN